MSARVRFGKTIVLAVSLQAALLLGCAELDALLGKPKTNQPLAGSSPAPTGSPTPGAFGQLGRDLTTAGRSVKAPIENARKAATEAIDNISDKDERAIGQATAFHIIQEQGGLVLDEELTLYVNEVANLVAQQGSRKVLNAKGQPRIKARRVFVGVLNNPGYNAFALPGGYILVTRGLLENMSSEAELAWVLAHEVAHVDHEHGLKALKTHVKLKAGLQELGVAGKSDSKASFDDSGFFGKMVVLLADVSQKVGLGKQDELDADMLGLEYTVKAGYDAAGAERVLGLLATAPSGKSLFKSHDTPETRVGLLREKIDKYKSKQTGIGRYDRRCVQRLEAFAITASASAAQPESGGSTPSPNGGSAPSP